MLYISSIWENAEIVKMRLKSVLLLTDYCYIDIRTAINVQDRTLGIWWCSDLYNTLCHSALWDVLGVCVHNDRRRRCYGGIIDIMDQSIWTLQNNRNLHRIDIKMWELKSNQSNYLQFWTSNLIFYFCAKKLYFWIYPDKQKNWGFILV